jgi:hypothetical protein
LEEIGNAGLVALEVAGLVHEKQCQVPAVAGRYENAPGAAAGIF